MGRITTKAAYTDHVKVVCKNHPNKMWHTKNIDFVGARSVFFEGEDSTVVPFAPSWKPTYPLGGFSPFKLLLSNMTGKHLHTGEPTGNKPISWEEIEKFVLDMIEMEKKYSFECECPFSDLILWPGYESLPEVDE